MSCCNSTSLFSCFLPCYAWCATSSKNTKPAPVELDDSPILLSSASPSNSSSSAQALACAPTVEEKDSKHNPESKRWEGRAVLEIVPTQDGKLELKGMNLTSEKIAELAACFPDVKTIDATGARIAGVLIVSEYEISSHFPNPQKISIIGLNRNYDLFRVELRY